MTIRKRKTWIAIAAVVLAGTSIASTAIGADTTTVTTTSTSPQGQVSQANRIAAPFSYFAGSPENAVALATALRNGTMASLTYAPTSTGTDAPPTTADITVPTKPMGWGNVSHALALAAYSLHQAGIEQPTAAQLQAALDGGAVTDANGKSITLPGVLKQRASGMGWGKIAQSYGTTMGAVNRGIQTSWAAAAAPASSPAATGTRSGVTTTASSRGVTAASGGSASGTTAVGSTGIGTASGGHAYGRGIVTASGGASSGVTTAVRGGSSGVVTGNGAASSVVNAGSGNGAAHGGGNGNGKGKGG
jgi:hypothetical protein